MVELTSRLVFSLIFITGLALFLYFDRDKVQRHYFLFYRRTEKGIEIIERIADRFPRFWNLYGWASVITGIVSVFAALVMILYTFFVMIFRQSTSQGPSLVLPGLVSENQFQAGVSFVPVEYWIIGVGILMVAHEMSHAIVARTENFEINSVGWIILGILPGAFVEPKGEKMLPGEDSEGDEVDDVSGMWEQGDWRSRLKVLSAGSFANYLIAAVFFILAVSVSSAVTAPGDVVYVADEGYPAADAGLNNGSLGMINGENISSVEDLQRVTRGIEVGDQVSLKTSEGRFSFEAGQRKGFEGGYIGIRVGKETVVKNSFSGFQNGIQWLVSLLWTVGLLNFLIGLFNMVPIKPLDGGLVVDTFLSRYSPNNVRLLNHFSLVGWALLMAAVLLSILGIP